MFRKGLLDVSLLGSLFVVHRNTDITPLFEDLLNEGDELIEMRLRERLTGLNALPVIRITDRSGSTITPTLLGGMGSFELTVKAFSEHGLGKDLQGRILYFDLLRAQKHIVLKGAWDITLAPCDTQNLEALVGIVREHLKISPGRPLTQTLGSFTCTYSPTRRWVAFYLEADRLRVLKETSLLQPVESAAAQDE